MRTNIEINNELMAEAMAAFGAKTKREAVERALQDAVRVQRQLRVLDELRGTGWHGDEAEVRGNRYTVAA